MSFRKFAASTARSIGLEDTIENLMRIVVRGRNAIQSERIQAEKKACRNRIFEPMQSRDGQHKPFYMIVLSDPDWADHKSNTNTKKIEGILKAESERREAVRYIEQNRDEFL